MKLLPASSSHVRRWKSLPRKRQDERPIATLAIKTGRNSIRPQPTLFQRIVLEFPRTRFVGSPVNREGGGRGPALPRTPAHQHYLSVFSSFFCSSCWSFFSSFFCSSCFSCSFVTSLTGPPGRSSM